MAPSGRRGKVLARLIEAGSLGNGSNGGSATSTVLQKMTPRETQVLELLMDGRANRDIAGAMGIDETTVKAHLGRMLRKTGASNRVELTLRGHGRTRVAPAGKGLQPSVLLWLLPSCLKVSPVQTWEKRGCGLTGDGESTTPIF